ncbi:MAG: heme o synthase [Myxococcota bacterium]|nr:heme o synthase [Myxococcota bacterium]MDW8363389.1 heme o synthase [Myxococcales bacterium]
MIALTKPRVTLMVLLTAAAGLHLAPQAPPAKVVVVTLLAIGLVVSSANAFNMWLERDVDARMARTRNRPLPAARLRPRTAFSVAVVLGLLALPALAWGAGLLTAALAALALVAYVAVYTPMKALSPAALLVGAVPGAIPPVLGWTAATNRLDPPAIALFALLFAWQVPHFVAIAVRRKDEYAAAGLRVLPAVHGERVARMHAAGWAAATLAASWALPALGLGGMAYAATATLAGGLYVAATLSRGERWATRTFVASLVYLPVVLTALVLDGSR